MSKEALKLALEALEFCSKTPNYGHTSTIEAITAIKEALAQPQRTWVGLTIEDIVALFPNEFLHSNYDTEKLISDVRIVEAKLKKKNT